MTHQNTKLVVVHMDVRKLKRNPNTNLPSFSKAKLERLIEQAVVDAYTEGEQVVGFRLWRFTAATNSGRESESSICRCRRQRPPVRNGSQRIATGAEDSE